MSPTHPRWLVVIVVLAVLGVTALVIRRVITDPSVPLLIDSGGGQWIGVEGPPQVMGHVDVESTCGFRRTFDVAAPLASAKLTFRALKRADVIVDGRTVLTATEDESKWKEGLAGDLAPLLTPGRHELVIVVKNSHGPACLLTFGDQPFLCTDTQWEASTDGANWVPTRVLSEPWTNPMAGAFEPADRALVSVLPYLLPVFAAVLAWSLIDRAARFAPSPSTLRWILLAAWTTLAINDFAKLPAILGFDLVFHEDYVKHIVEHGRVPLANDGWQMFQSPLYYLASAPLFAMTKASASLRVLPLLAGILQVELCYRAVRTVFPERRDLQSFGLVLGSLLPMNLYISQYAGNEAPAAFFVGVVCVLALAEPKRGTRVALGVALGLALLTKVSAVLMIAPVGLVLLRVDVLRGLRHLAIVLAVAALVSGWYFVRNYAELGSFVVAGWDPARGMGWWQDPGYRTPADLTRFGESLVHPVYASFAGFWDGVYCTFWTDGFLSGKPDPRLAPPWNFGFLWSLVWLSIPLALAIAAGGIASAFRPRDEVRTGVSFAAIAVAIYLAAMALMFLEVPYYSVTKASYTSGLAPAYAVLAAAGFALVAKVRVLRAIGFALLASWAVAAYVAFFAG